MWARPARRARTPPERSAIKLRHEPRHAIMTPPRAGRERSLERGSFIEPAHGRDKIQTKAKSMTTVFKQILAFGVLAGVTHLAYQSADAGPACKGVDMRLTKQRRVDYAKRVAESLNQNVKPSTVDVTKFMQA